MSCEDGLGVTGGLGGSVEVRYADIDDAFLGESAPQAFDEKVAAGFCGGCGACNVCLVVLMLSASLLDEWFAAYS